MHHRLHLARLFISVGMKSLPHWLQDALQAAAPCAKAQEGNLFLISGCVLVCLCVCGLSTREVNWSDRNGWQQNVQIDSHEIYTLYTGRERDNMHVCIHIYVYTYIYIYIYIHVYTSTDLSLSLSMCIYIYIYVCMYVCMCVYIYIYICSLSTAWADRLRLAGPLVAVAFWELL